jgi:hypothetical protein
MPTLAPFARSSRIVAGSVGNAHTRGVRIRKSCDAAGFHFKAADESVDNSPSPANLAPREAESAVPAVIRGLDSAEAGLSAVAAVMRVQDSPKTAGTADRSRASGADALITAATAERPTQSRVSATASWRTPTRTATPSRSTDNIQPFHLFDAGDAHGLSLGDGRVVHAWDVVLVNARPLPSER